MDHKHYAIRTRNSPSVYYDNDDVWPKNNIDGNPRWKTSKFDILDRWLPLHGNYVGFGTSIGPMLFYAATKVKRAVGIEGDPSAPNEVILVINFTTCNRIKLSLILSYLVMKKMILPNK